MEARTSAPTACPICGGARPVEFLRRASVPVHQNLLLSSPEAAQALARGQLTMVVCPECGFARNATFDPGLLDYGAEYDNTQTHSPAFNRYVEGLVQGLVEQRGVRGRRVIEVGCGKGTFLTKLVVYPGADNVGFGFDPTYVGPDAAASDCLHFQRSFYDPANGPAADVMVCRHVIEHVTAPLELLRSMHAGLVASPDGRVFVETPCLEWILRHEVVWDFFYEHCSLFTAAALAEALTRAGFAVMSVGHVFDGQYLWAEAKAISGSRVRQNAGETASLPRSGERGDETTRLVEEARRFRDRERQQVAAWRERLRRLRSSGDVAIWGAGAKGVTFCNLADPDREQVACVIDVNPAKQGNYVGGTGHPIIAPDRIGAGVRAVVVLNPQYTEEVAARLAHQGSHAAVIDLMRAA